MARIPNHHDRDPRAPTTKRTSQRDRGLGWDWVKFRRHRLADRPFCAGCIVWRGYLEGASLLHHIIPRSYAVEYSCAPWNVTSLCGRCHVRIHRGGKDEMARLILIEKEDYELLCDGGQIQLGPVRVQFAEGICQPSPMPPIMLNESIAARLFAGETVTVGGRILDWDEGHGPGHPGEVAAKLRKQLEPDGP